MFFVAQIFHHFVDVVAILNRFARAISDGRAIDVEGALVDGGLGEHHAGIVLIPIRSALDAAGIALHQDAMAGGGLDVEHHVGLLGQRERPPGGVADHHAAVASGGAGGGEGAAMIQRGAALAIDVIGSHQAQAFQAVRSHRQRRAQLAQFDGGVHDHDVGQVDGAAFPARAGIGGAVGDAFHFRENFLIEAVQEESGGGGARQVPAFVLVFGIQLGGAALHVLRDFLGHQMPVLIAALVRLAFDVDVDPSAHGIAIGGTVGGDSGRRGPRLRRRTLRQP